MSTIQRTFAVELALEGSAGLAGVELQLHCPGA